MIGRFGGRFHWRAGAPTRGLWLGSSTTALLVLAGCQSDPNVGPGADLPTPPNPPSSMDSELPVTPAGETEVDCSKVAPGGAEARLLTRLQYDNTVRDLLGDTSAPAQSFPPENTMLGFGNNADAHRASLLLAEEQLAAAEGVASRAVGRGLDGMLPCEA